MAGSSPSDAESLPLETARRRIGSVTGPIDRTDRIPLSVATGRILATDATANEPIGGAEISVGDAVFEQGHQIRPGDVGLLKAAGISELLVRQRPQVGILPTGDELGQRDAGKAQQVETAGFTLSQYVDRWGGKVTYRDPVADDAPALRMAVQRDLTRDMIVITGTEPGDTLRDVVADLGDVLTDTIAIDPGGQTGLAVVADRPVVLLPESPTGARVSAVQLVRPLLKTFAHAPLAVHPETRATLAAQVDSQNATRTFRPVTVSDGTATPLSGDELATATRADGWISVPAGETGLDAGATVSVENWDYLP
ncbi:molybdenum cofactor biosynthesis protein [Haloarcula sp. CBA1130]|uniref:molybdopterin-binding protein n=1 Tax=unclassified Haloarcula TaxID=2624677 RepID=UPI0012494542|nr:MULTISPECIES: molybdopterin-binding protein [unclassified Haloarcula]KAA9398469.1 molybdenum cofactor biosynthesis protein [Haloarcula sp. CBA1129]KAA9401939.1 molybdenum cofactor biosynthesis protein [Haloarcula sp. CBA1130]